MNVLALLIPATLVLGCLGLVAFFWLLRSNQFDDPEGNAHRILSDRYDDRPAEDAKARSDSEGEQEKPRSAETDRA